MGRGSGIQGRTREGVVLRVESHVDQEARMVGAVEIGAQDARRVLRALARDLDVEAFGVMLRLVHLARELQRNGLGAENIVARGDVVWNRDLPCVAIVEELLGRPEAISDIARICWPDQTALGKLEPLELRLVGFAAWAVATSQIVDNRAPMQRKPHAPVHLDGRAGLEGSLQLAGLGLLVANDVGG